MPVSFDVTIWMTNILLIISHIAVAHVGHRQDMINSQWLGSFIIENLGVLGYIGVIFLLSFLVTVIGYLFMKNYKLHIIVGFCVALFITLVYNLYVAFN